MTTSRAWAEDKGWEILLAECWRCLHHGALLLWIFWVGCWLEPSGGSCWGLAVGYELKNSQQQR